MIRLIMQNLGKAYALGIKGDNEQEIKEQYYSFYNHSATNGDLLNLGAPDIFGYVWTTPEKTLAALQRAELARLLNKSDSKYHRFEKSDAKLTPITEQIKNHTKELAQVKFNQIINERFLKTVSFNEIPQLVEI